MYEVSFSKSVKRKKKDCRNVTDDKEDPDPVAAAAGKADKRSFKSLI